jgi:uncharacterized protein
MDRLDARARDRITARYSQVLGDRMQGMTPNQASQAASTLTQAGYLRLDDEHHIRRLALLVQALGAADVKSCAAIAKASFTSTVPNQQQIVNVIVALDSGSLEEWLNLSIDADTAEIAGTPPKRLVTETQFSGAFQRLAARWSTDTFQRFQRTTQNPAIATYTDLCDAYRDLYAAAASAPQADAVLFSLYDLGASSP